MTKKSSLRLAVTQDGLPATGFWKIWAHGDEIYAVRRTFAGVPPSGKISIHRSGQVHVRPEGRDMQRLHDAGAIGDGWWAALHLQFLVDRDALRPHHDAAEARELADKRAKLIWLPADHFAIVSILIQDADAPDVPPGQWSNFDSIWSAALRGGRQGHALAQVYPRNDATNAFATWIRSTLRPEVSLERDVRDPYMEITHIAPNRAGNVVTVVPMDRNAIWFPPQTTGAAATAPVSLGLRISGGSAPIPAPDGALIGEFQIPTVETAINLIRDQASSVQVGEVALVANWERLDPEGKFELPSIPVVLSLSIAGSSPKTFELRLRCFYDRNVLIARLQPASTALLGEVDANLGSAIGDKSSVTVLIPIESVECTLRSRETGEVRMPLVARLTLRGPR